MADLLGAGVVTAGELALLIKDHGPFAGTNEYVVQDAIEKLLRDRALDYRREHVLSVGDRIDFLVGDVGVEVKIDGGKGAVLRQLFRYAVHPGIAGLVLVTTRAKHLQGLPPTIFKKPVVGVYVAAWL